MFSASRSIAPAWVVCAGFLLVVLFFGGGSASTVSSIVFLRPLAALALVFGLWWIDWTNIGAFRWPLFLLVAVILLVGVHLVPLPPGWWAALPGREIELRAIADAGIEPAWRPIALVPSGAWNALFSLLIPAATMILMIGCSEAGRSRMLGVMLGFGAVTCAVAVLQVTVQSPSLYFFEITNSGTAVGLFANRNHQAIFLACLLPMLALFASAPGMPSDVRIRRTWIGAGGALLVFPLLLITGSRAGLLLAFPALLFAVVLYEASLPQKDRSAKRRRLRMLCYAAAIAAIVAIGGLFILFARAEAVSRLAASLTEGESNNRLPFWRLLPDMIWQYFPWGSGVGSFPEVFQIHEPTSLLKTTYLNHAHNDVLEVALVAGLPGIVLMLVGVLIFALSVVRLTRPDGIPLGRLAYARLGAMVLILLGLASFVDYPLRTPSLAAIFAVAVIWTAQGCAHRAAAQKENLKEGLS